MKQGPLGEVLTQKETLADMAQEDDNADCVSP